MATWNKRETVYTVIYKDLRNRIFSGQFQPGDLLPSEKQLCAEFDSSRETVRKGLKLLESEGLIFSRPKIGYFVSSPNHNDFILSYSEEFLNCTAQYCDISGLVPDANLQKCLHIPEDRKVIKLSQIYRNSEGTPIAYEEKFIPYERAYPSVESEMRYAVLPEITLSKIATFEYYAEVEISAVLAGESEAKMLGCKVGDALLLTERFFTRQDDRRIGYSRHFCCHPHSVLRGITGIKRNHG